MAGCSESVAEGDFVKSIEKLRKETIRIFEQEIQAEGRRVYEFGIPKDRLVALKECFEAYKRLIGEPTSEETP